MSETHRHLLLTITVAGAILTAGHRLSSAATEHMVGDSIWAIPPTDGFYIDWAKNRSFVAGDSLLFRFETGFYDVVQISRREYDDCTSMDLYRVYKVGPVSVPLTHHGNFYFVCTFGNYCSLGLKVFVSVSPSGGGG